MGWLARRRNAASERMLIAHSLTACVATLLGHGRDDDLPAAVRRHYPRATDERIAAAVTRYRELSKRAYYLCAYDHRADRHEHTADEIRSTITREFPDYPHEVLNRAIARGYHDGFLH